MPIEAPARTRRVRQARSRARLAGQRVAQAPFGRPRLAVAPLPPVSGGAVERIRQAALTIPGDIGPDVLSAGARTIAAAARARPGTSPVSPASAARQPFGGSLARTNSAPALAIAPAISGPGGASETSCTVRLQPP